MCSWFSISSLSVFRHTCTRSQHCRANVSSSLVYLPVVVFSLFFSTFGKENYLCLWIHTDPYATIICILLLELRHLFPLRFPGVLLPSLLTVNSLSGAFCWHVQRKRRSTCAKFNCEYSRTGNPPPKHTHTHTHTHTADTKTCSC